jgi:alcohol dehydrogenase
MQAHRYPAMLEMIRAGRLEPGRLLGRRITLDEAAQVLPHLDRDTATGVTIIGTF